MSDLIRSVVTNQLDTAWRLLDFHLVDLGDAESLWRPASRGPHVVRDGPVWKADWPESEGYELGPPSIAWLTWHVGFWWSMTLNHSFGDQTLQREEVHWPGTAASVRKWLTELHDEWAGRVAELPDEDLVSRKLTRWPFSDKPFHILAGWLNMELMKNAAEIGYCRFLYKNVVEVEPAGHEGGRK